ncbi:MAG: TlpA disulfide reductase family protein [Thermodesulfobacteriota bacterium]
MQHISAFRRLAALALLLCVLASPASSGAGLPATVRPLDLIAAIGAAKGKVVVVNFWATWCAPCRVEVPELMRLRSHYPQSEVEILGVSVDESQASLDSFLRKLPLNYPVGRATEDVPRMFQVGAIPKLMVYDRQGSLIHIREGMTSSDDLRRMVDALLAK